MVLKYFSFSFRILFFVECFKRVRTVCFPLLNNVSFFVIFLRNISVSCVPDHLYCFWNSILDSFLHATRFILIHSLLHALETLVGLRLTAFVI